MNPESGFLIGHIVCISQWCAFMMVDYAYLGKGRVWPLWLWTTVLVAGELFLGIKLNIGFFTLLSIWENVGFVLVSTLLFGGTLAQKLTAALINGTMCLLAENTVRYVASWATHTSLLTIWKRMDCLVAMTITNVIVGVLVAYFAHKWKTARALESPQALVMSFFPGIVVVLNVVLMLSAEDKPADFLMLLLTLGLTVAVLIHMGIVQMFNEQMAQQQALHVQAALERERAEALMDSYTTQRRLTHEFTNHTDALALLLQQGISLHIQPWHESALTPPVFAAVEQLIENLFAEEGHAYLIGVRKAERKADIHFFFVLIYTAGFSAGITAGLLYPSQRFFQFWIKHRVLQ